MTKAAAETHGDFARNGWKIKSTNSSSDKFPRFLHDLDCVLCLAFVSFFTRIAELDGISV